MEPEQRSSLSGILVVLLISSWFLQSESVAAKTASKSFQDCELQLEQLPPQEAARCFYETARETSQWQEAAERLAGHLDQNPTDPWLRLNLAHTVRNLTGDRPRGAEDLYRQAIAGFVAAKETKGEILARKGLRNFLLRRSRHTEAAEQSRLIRALYKSSPDLENQLRRQILEAEDQYYNKRDLGRALRLLKEIDLDLPKVNADGSLDDAQLKALLVLGAVSIELGQLQQAEEYLKRAEEVESRHPDVLARTSIHMNQTLVSLYRNDRYPLESQRPKILQDAYRWARSAEAAGHREAAAAAHLEIGKLVGYPRGVPHFERCIEIAREDQDPVLRSECLVSLAMLLAPVDPQEALTVRQEALEVARKSGEARTLAAVFSSALVVSWETLDPETALDHSLQALDLIEELRDMQTGEEGRLGLFSEWAPYYQRLVGYLLRTYQSSGNRRFLEQAFQVSERMRSRVLQEALDLAAHEKDVPIPAPLQENLTLIQTEMNRVNRHLLEDELPAQERKQFTQDLERLEFQWAEKQHEILRLQRGSLVAPETPDHSLRQVQEALEPHEALLSFQVAPDQDIYRTFFGGSWVLAVTRDEVIVQDLGDGTFLPKKIEFLLGLLENRDPGLEGQALESLYTGLMEKAVQRLPKEVTRLILVPDGALHSLPFTALRIGSNSNFGERFQVTRSPSATLWLRWRNQPVESSPFPALVLTDPELETTATEGVVTAETRGAPPGLVHRSRLGSLPLARKEGRDVLRHLGRGTQLREGAAATEALVRSLDLTRYQILHFAAHAKADAENPKRSAIYLARSSEDRDGLLQFREIVDLNLDGRIVVLSACDTATGEILRGEGVLDLARAFFQGGAHAVVASLWPLRDDDGRDFFDAFYRHLAEGESLAGALQGAQIDRIEAGAPAAAWAGIVVLGDGSMVPFPNAKARLSFVTVVLLAFGLFLVAAVIASLLAKGRAP